MEHSSKGLFQTPGHGRNFRRRIRPQEGALDRFAALLAEHVSPEDAARSGKDADPGGNAGECAVRMGQKRAQGNLMLQRIRKKLGWQAR